MVGAALLAEADTAGTPVVYAPDVTAMAAAVCALRAAGHEPLAGFSFYSTDAERAFAARAALVEAVPVRSLAGGVHASARPEATLRAGFDLVAIGEGEGTLVELVRALGDGRPVEGVPGLAWLEGGQLRRSGPAPRHPLDRFPAFYAPLRRFNPIEITRGCVYACRFCQTPFAFSARFRHRSVEDVAAHVAAMAAAGLDYVRFVSPTALSYGSPDAGVRLDRVEALLRAVRAAMPRGRIYFGTFPSELRPEHVSAEAVALVRAWCDNDSLAIGGQSGSEALLARTRRGHGVDDIVRAVELSVAGGLRPDVDLLFGLPGESPEEQLATVALAERLVALGARVHSHAFLPLPGTPLGEARPAPIDPRVGAAIARLESKGAAWGQWRRQLEDARRLGRPTA